MAFPSLSIGDLTAKMPIVQGGMGVGISLSGLASAVANQGGIGVIAGAMIGMKEPDVAKNPIEANLRALRQELTKAREKTQGIIGVNIMVALTTFSQMVRTAIENRADIIFSGAGLPLEMPKHLLQACEEKKEEFKTKLVPIVSSARAATLIARKWLSRFDYLPDAFVVEGPKAGGHLGFKREEINDPNFALEVLVPQVVEAAKRLEDQKGRAVPVIAAGGIYTGEDIKKFLDLGASGVQMGTRFVATKECDADDRFKQSYISAREEDITIIKSPVGMPGRALQNDFIEAEDIVIDAKSGTTGAGRKGVVPSLFCEVYDTFRAYGLGKHRHTPEIEQEFSRAAGCDVRVSFNPHLVPMVRGILSTIYTTLRKPGTTLDEVHAAYCETWAQSPWVRVLPKGKLPETRFVRGSMFCDLGLVVDPRTNRLIVVSAIDNLCRGASGQALANANLMCGLPVDCGLNAAPMLP